MDTAHKEKSTGAGNVPDRLYIGMFERITELVSLLGNAERALTIREISEITETSLEQTREDLALLHRSGIRLAPARTAEALRRDDPRFDEEILMLGEDLTGSHPLLFLRENEQPLYAQRPSGSLRIKDTPQSIPDEIRRRARSIEEAVRIGCYVHFLYRSPLLPGAERVEVAPLMLFHNTTDDLYYCITYIDDVIYAYRLDRILFDVHLDRAKRVRMTNKEQAVSRARLEHLHYCWGAAFDKDAVPVHVKLEICPNTANILTKIRNDTADRRFGSLREEDGRFLYEDDVIGLNSFRSWVLAYGSSVKVLEPRTLAEEVVESSRLRLLNYTDGSRFH